MIRIRFDADKVDLTIRTIPNHSQITVLERLPNIISDIKYDFNFEEIQLDNKCKESFESFISAIKQLEEK